MVTSVWLVVSEAGKRLRKILKKVHF